MTVARPTKTPAWATDTDYAAGSDPWSGTPTRVEPDSGDKASGAVPGGRTPAQWINFLIGYLADWILYFGTLIGSNEELTYQTPKSRVIYISPPWASPFEFSGGAPAFNPFGTGWSQIAASQDLFIPIQLPVGCKITQVDALLKGAGGGGHADDSTLKVYKSDRTQWLTNNTWTGAGGGPVTPAQLGSTATVASSSIAGIGVTPGGGGETVTAGFIYYAKITGDSGNATELTVFGLRVTFNDPGPRNA